MEEDGICYAVGRGKQIERLARMKQIERFERMSINKYSYATKEKDHVALYFFVR